MAEVAKRQLTGTFCRPTLINSSDAQGKTAIFLAASEGQNEALSFLLSSGAAVNHADKYGESALFQAVRYQHVPCVEILIAGGADINLGPTVTPQAIPSTPVINAKHPPKVDPAISAEDELARSLTPARADALPLTGDAEKFSPLHVAAEENAIECMRLLLKHKAKVDARSSPSLSTPLMIGAKFGNTTCMKLLLTNRAEVNAVNADGNSALHFAAMMGEFSAAEVLLDASAELQLVNHAELNPQRLAHSRNHANVSQLLTAYAQSAILTEPVRTECANLRAEVAEKKVAISSLEEDVQRVTEERDAARQEIADMKSDYISQKEVALRAKMDLQSSIEDGQEISLINSRLMGQKLDGLGKSALTSLLQLHYEAITRTQAALKALKEVERCEMLSSRQERLFSPSAAGHYSPTTSSIDSPSQ